MRIRIKNDGTLEEQSLALQIVLAELEKVGVHGLGGLNLYFTPLRQDGNERSFDPIDNAYFETIKTKPKPKRK